MLFNWVGYRLLNSLLEDAANKQLETVLDNNAYNESDLVSIKIPVSYLPYYNNSSVFERINGQVEIQGIEYKFVKRRIYNDSLEMLCIPNPAVMKLKEAKNEFFRFFNDLQHNGDNKSDHSRHSTSKNFSGDYYTLIYPYKFKDPCLYIPPLQFQYLFHTSLRFFLIPEQPPENA